MTLGLFFAGFAYCAYCGIAFLVARADWACRVAADPSAPPAIQPAE